MTWRRRTRRPGPKSIRVCETTAFLNSPQMFRVTFRTKNKFLPAALRERDFNGNVHIIDILLCFEFFVIAAPAPRPAAARYGRNFLINVVCIQVKKSCILFAPVRSVIRFYTMFIVRAAASRGECGERENIKCRNLIKPFFVQT